MFNSSDGASREGASRGEFRRLYETVFPVLYKVAYRITSNEEAASQEEDLDPALVVEIEGFIAERNEAKKMKNYTRADEIRRILKDRGIILEDSPSGTSYRKS